MLARYAFLLLCLLHSNNVAVVGQEEVASVSETELPAIPEIVVSEHQRCGEIIDMHLHLAQWFQSVDGLLAEMDRSSVDRGILYAVYGPGSTAFPADMPDPNDQVSEMASNSQGRMFGFASCNTTHANWNAMRDEELMRLQTYLDMPEFVGAKLAPPHTCLPLDGERIRDVVRTVSESTTPVLAIHVGTTPFCGPLGAMFGLKACCSQEYVSPSLLAPLVEQYAETTFVLLHSGHDYLPIEDINFYNGELVDESIALAQKFPNVYLEISALHSETDPSKEDDFSYPGGLALLQKIVNAGLTNKMIWGSDANHVQGRLVEAMKESFEDMIAAGMTDEERCQSVAGLSKTIFGLNEADADGGVDGKGDDADTDVTSGVAALCFWSSFASVAASLGIAMVANSV